MVSFGSILGVFVGVCWMSVQSLAQVPPRLTATGDGGVTVSVAGDGEMLLERLDINGQVAGEVEHIATVFAVLTVIVFFIANTTCCRH